MVLSLLLSTAAVLISAYVIPGIEVESFWVAIVTAIVLGVITSLLKPLLVILTLPINLLTLGLFTLVINAMLVMLAAAVVPGFAVTGFLPALIFSVVLGLVNGFLAKLK